MSAILFGVLFLGFGNLKVFNWDGLYYGEVMKYLNGVKLYILGNLKSTDFQKYSGYVNWSN